MVVVKLMMLLLLLFMFLFPFPHHGLVGLRRVSENERVVGRLRKKKIKIDCFCFRND